MCGFVATLTPRSIGRLAHRGPDGSGAVVEHLPWANVSLEMTRLAIVDRRKLQVPFDFRKSCGVVLAFNGEVYNWRQLRDELSDGTPWETDCDAEVVARAWRRWGVKMLDRLNGMWGLVLVDEREQVVFVARDRAGEKPLYYAPLGIGWSFASEIKALPVLLEEASCRDLETLEFDCLENTPFKGVKCLGPGQYMLLSSVVDLEAPKIDTWWMLPSKCIDESMSWESAVDQVEALLVDAIKLRAVSEVPVAVQLSGGLDSAIVQAVVKSERLYTVTFPYDGVDNLKLACLAAGGREPVAIEFTRDALEEVLPRVAYHLDTPATWTAVCQWFMDKKIAEDGGVIVLSGEGADELFLGYSRYRLLWWYERMRSDPNLKAYHPLIQSMHGTGFDIIARMLNRGGPAAHPYARELVGRFSGCWDNVNNVDLCLSAARVDFYTTMQVLLRMADRMAAAHSLENRSPFFDYRLMELSQRLPLHWKIHDYESKSVLRKVAERLGVPKAIVEDKTKRGLFVPASWWKSEWRTPGERGVWDRHVFAGMMRDAWRKAFGLM